MISEIIEAWKEYRRTGALRTEAHPYEENSEEEENNNVMPVREVAVAS